MCLPGRPLCPALLSTRLILFPWRPTTLYRDSAHGPLKATNQGYYAECALSGRLEIPQMCIFTSTRVLLNSHLAGRAQMWQCRHRDLGRLLSTIIVQKDVYAILFSIILLACTFQTLDNLWHKKISLEQDTRCSNYVTMLEFGLLKATIPNERTTG